MSLLWDIEFINISYAYYKYISSACFKKKTMVCIQIPWMQDWSDKAKSQNSNRAFSLKLAAMQNSRVGPCEEQH